MKKNIYVTILATVIAVCSGVFVSFSISDQQTMPTTSESGYEALDNKAIGWGIKKVKNEEPEIPAQQQELLMQYNSFYMDKTKPKKLYLTFDEGYENGYTSKILDTLKEKNVPAAFFITAPYAKEQTELINRMINEGHIVGNHTINHPNLPKLGAVDKITEELVGMNNLVKELYNYEMKYMRPPEGEYSQKVLSIANDLGFKTVLWSFAYKDWDTNSQNGKDYAISQVTPYLHDGAILLLHAVSKDNADALGEIIDFARSNGYEFASLDEIKTT